MNISLNRVILFVQNVKALKNFYQQHFDFELLEEISEDWALLKAGTCELALHQAGASVNDGDAATANNNVKLVFETSTDLHQLRQQLIGADVKMKEVKSFGLPYLFCDGADTEGNVFQLMQRID